MVSLKRMTIGLAAMGLCAVVVAAAKPTSPIAAAEAAPPVAVRWEYKVMSAADGAEISPYQVRQAKLNAVQASLNELGEQGWELVSTGNGQWVFRRIKQ